MQIICGVVTLHKDSSYCGDLKLDNIRVLLGPNGHLCLTDVAPTPGYTPEYLALEITFRRPALTAERDIFALGLILWALSEEISSFERSDFSSAPTLVW